MFKGWFRLAYRYTYTLREDWELINKKMSGITTYKLFNIYINYFIQL